MKRDNGRLRRVVPSPAPLGILELAAITTISNSGSIVICAGGGGVPVARNSTGTLRGVEAVLLHQVGIDEIDEFDFESGSMQPKVAAARPFARETGCKAAIGATCVAVSVYNGERGTTVNPLL